MTTYNQGVFRSGTYGGGSGPDPLVPEPVAQQIIEEMPKASVLLQRARQVTMSTKTDRLPVLSVLPVSYWVGGDTALEQTTQQQWKNVTLVAEELAAIVPIPKAYLDDAQVPIWDEVRPRLTEACGRLVDLAGLFGVNRPSTWSPSIYEAAVTAGNTVPASAAEDAAVTVAKMGVQLAQDGYSVNGFAARPGYNWKLVQMRSSGSGVPIFQQDLSADVKGSLYGYPLSEVDNGSWQTGTDLIAGDWSKAVVGLRQDISFSMSDQSVISNDAGAVVLNLFQANAVAMKVVMRVGFVTANPITNLNATDSTRYPFSVLQNISGS